MINKLNIEKLLKKRKVVPVYNDIDAMDIAEDIFIALGDDEEEVYEYLSSLDEDTFGWFDEIYEEISEKFNSDRIEELFHNYNKNNK